MSTVAIIACSVLVGAAAGYLVGEATIRHLRKRLKELRARDTKRNVIQSITRFLFVTTQVCALIWVSWSYVIATYSTMVLMQPFPVETLSCQAIITILGMSGLKVVENIFEHNEGTVFGRSKAEQPVPPQEEEATNETDAAEG